MAQLDELVGWVERTVFENEESGFLVIKVKEKNKKELTTIVGSLAGVHPGHTITCKGIWKHRPQYGWSFEVQQFSTEPPKDREAILKYLESGQVKGIGPAYAKKIVDHFGQRTLQVISESPQELEQVEGIGPKRRESIIHSWKEQEGIRDLLLFLQPHGISILMAQKIYRVWGAHAVSKIRENPYKLSQEVWGIGFIKADEIAMKLGTNAQDPIRLQSCIEYILQQASQEGHTCLPLELTLERAQSISQASTFDLKKAIQELMEAKTLIQEELPFQGQMSPYLWLGASYGREQMIAKRLRYLTSHKPSTRSFDTQKALAWAQDKHKLELAAKQQEAVATACVQKVMILTGGPGTGKSTITQIIVSIFKKLGAKVLLAAPTGRAAKRLAEINQMSAQTLHQLLEFDFRQMDFKRNQQHKLDVDLVIVDEASMLDTHLTHSLLKALPDGCRLILVGDTDQLPSVGSGNILRDLIDSKHIPTIALKEIYRQAQTSQIVLCAHEINRGLAPIHENKTEDDFFFLKLESPERIIATILSLVCERLPRKYGFDPFRDIQVLAPMKRGILGIENLNQQLQEHLQMHQQPIQVGHRRFFIGDKLMQIRNNYEKEIFNGDLLFVEEVDPSIKTLTAKTLDGRILEYTFSDLDELSHAYAVSVHKYQGSECPCILMPVHSTHTIMLDRNLLYTAVTRGKKLVILLGSPEALKKGCIMQNAQKRYTGLTQAMTRHFGSWGEFFEHPLPAPAT
jgi:exodeoxyribonuclease V alpha subunit